MNLEDPRPTGPIERTVLWGVLRARQIVFNPPQHVFEVATHQKTADLYVIVWLGVLLMLCGFLSYTSSRLILFPAALLGVYRLADLLSHHFYSMFAGRGRERSTAGTAILIAFVNLIQVALSFGILFVCDEQLAEESFTVSSGKKMFRIGEALYYSFVTLTTLGAPDITAVRLAAKVLTVLEVFVGLALIVLVVGRHLDRHSRQV